MNKIYFLLCGCMLCVSCRRGEPRNEVSDYRFVGDTLCIAENSGISKKIALLTVQSEPYGAEFTTTGVVKAIPGQLAEIAPPVDGRVLKSFVRLGQHVNAGAPIFELSSVEFFEASKNYFQTLQNQKMAENNYRRQKDMVQHGVGVQKELEEAETNYEFARKECENAVAGLRMFNIDPDRLTMGQALNVTSPVAGEVVHMNIVTGQYVKNDSPPLAVVADLSKVWVVAQVKERYIEAVRPDDRAEIQTDADAAHTIAGRVYHISELLDEETRSVRVMIVCDNTDRKLKPGMFADVRFIAAPKESVVIPSSALLQTESGSYVFAQAGKNKYLKRYVKAVTAGQNRAMITDGLQSGDVIVSSGGIYLPGI